MDLIDHQFSETASEDQKHQRQMGIVACFLHLFLCHVHWYNHIGDGAIALMIV